MASSETVIELSVEETNRLRIELGLRPLRGVGESNASAAQQSQPSPKMSAMAGSNTKEEEAVLELSIDETNALRQRLGLTPLRTSTSAAGQQPVHAPADNELEIKGAASRIERAKLLREVQAGIETQFAAPSLGADTSTAKSWAVQMRNSNSTSTTSTTHHRPNVQQQQQSSRESRRDYDDSDLKGLNVEHSVDELQEGSTTVLTLADAPLLKTRVDVSGRIIEHNAQDVSLQNVNLIENQQIERGLHEKRKVELGMGRAGGYAGLDDDEFVELGGTQAPSRLNRGGTYRTPTDTTTKDESTHARVVKKGFQIGVMFDEQDAALESSDLFASLQPGRAISLEQSHANGTTVASDFMTREEEEALMLETKKKKRDKAMFKKEKKKKEKKKSKRREEESDDDDGKNDTIHLHKTDLLSELEETAVNVARKRKRRDDDVDDEGTGDSRALDEDDSKDKLQNKRSKYDQIMAKGNERSHRVFGVQKNMSASDNIIDEEPDDAFLNAALDKARRLNRLKEISQQRKIGSGADTVVAAVQRSAANTADVVPSEGTVTFAVDETREFTRALMARTEQQDRARKKVLKEDPLSINTGEGIVATEVPSSHPRTELSNGTVKEVAANEEEEEIDIHELAKQVKDDDNTMMMNGAPRQAVAASRGVGSIISLLQQSGEITRKNAGKEEMRGRAKDKRTYEDYEPLDLSKVVRIDEQKATSKDKELAHREVKLEYRDKHGRLLTRKEAFRDLSYQFHGYGSGKRKEEKKMEQIARERAEARLASRQSSDVAGTFGALKATQKASGKAFVVHKSGN